MKEAVNILSYINELTVIVTCVMLPDAVCVMLHEIFHSNTWCVIAGISKKSRSLFLELDATAAKTHHQQQPSVSPLKSPLPVDDARRRSREV
jgi:hypothetical protein